MLPTANAIQIFIETNFGKELSALNTQRKKSLFSSFTSLIGLVLIPTTMFGVNYLFWGSPNQTKIMIGSFIALFVVLFLFSIYYSRNSPDDFEDTFKQKVIKPLIQFINPNFKYNPQSFINHQEFMQLGFFENLMYTYDGNDQLIGKHNDVLFQFCDLDVTISPRIRSRNESDDTVFCGNFFMAKFNKPFKTETYIMPSYSLKENLLGDDFETVSYLVDTWQLGNEVKLEDVTFNKKFKVLSHDQIEARYILTPTLMERIKRVQEKTKGKLFISFRNNLIFIANNNGFDYFEPDFYKSINTTDYIMDYYNEITELLGIIDELKLNIKIWQN
jgi:hypothetical protein